MESFWTARGSEEQLLPGGPGEETSGCGPWNMLELGWQLDKMILKVSASSDDSVASPEKETSSAIPLHIFKPPSCCLPEINNRLGLVLNASISRE